MRDERKNRDGDIDTVYSGLTVACKQSKPPARSKVHDENLVFEEAAYCKPLTIFIPGKNRRSSRYGNNPEACAVFNVPQPYFGSRAGCNQGARPHGYKLNDGLPVTCKDGQGFCPVSPALPQMDRSVPVAGGQN